VVDSSTRAVTSYSIRFHCECLYSVAVSFGQMWQAQYFVDVRDIIDAFKEGL